MVFKACSGELNQAITDHQLRWQGTCRFLISSIVLLDPNNLGMADRIALLSLPDKLFHIYSQLWDAMFGLRLTPMSERECKGPVVLLNHENKGLAIGTSLLPEILRIEYEWCQWLGCHLKKLVKGSTDHRHVIPFYPVLHSTRHHQTDSKISRCNRLCSKSMWQELSHAAY